MILLLPLLILMLIPVNADAITGQDADFMVYNGVPTVMADSTTACNNQAKVVFYMYNGVPTQVLDSTATCTAPVASGGGTKQDVIWFE